MTASRLVESLLENDEDFLRDMGVDPFAMTDDDWEAFYRETQKELSKSMPRRSRVRRVPMADNEIENYLQNTKQSYLRRLISSGMKYPQAVDYLNQKWPTLEAEFRKNPARSVDLSTEEVQAQQDAWNRWLETSDGKKWSALSQMRLFRGFRQKDFPTDQSSRSEEEFQAHWAQQSGFGQKPEADDALKAWDAANRNPSAEVQRILRDRARDISSQL